MSGDNQIHSQSGLTPLYDPVTLHSIIAAASDLALWLQHDGMIKTVVPGASVAGLEKTKSWEGRHVNDVLTSESQPKLEARLASDDADRSNVPLELNHVSDDIAEFPVSYRLFRFDTGGDVLLLGRDLRGVAQTQQKLVETQIALEQDYELRLDNDLRFRALMQEIGEAILFVSLSDGRITEVNDAAATLLDGSVMELRGRRLEQILGNARGLETLAALTDAASSESQLEVTSVGGGDQKMVAYPAIFRTSAGQVLLLRLRRNDAVLSANNDLSTTLLALYNQSDEAVVITDPAGTIRTANRAFLELTNAASVNAVRGRTVGDFLSRGGVEAKVMLDTAIRKGQMRLSSVALQGSYGAQATVDISATYLSELDRPDLVLMIRRHRDDRAERATTNLSDDNARGVAELVGSVTLKEIVSETTEVIEKICIETATELTNNNRVAAAEMLGLSRQSLYVKLRRYNLLEKEQD